MNYFIFIAASRRMIRMAKAILLITMVSMALIIVFTFRILMEVM